MLKIYQQFSLKNMQKVNTVKQDEFYNVTMIMKIKHQSNERKIMKKNKDEVLQKQNDRYILFKDLVISCVELDTRLEAMEKSLIFVSIIDSENNQLFENEMYAKVPEKNNSTNKTYIYHFDDTWSLDRLGLKD